MEDWGQFTVAVPLCCQRAYNDILEWLSFGWPTQHSTQTDFCQISWLRVDTNIILLKKQREKFSSSLPGKYIRFGQERYNLPVLKLNQHHPGIILWSFKLHYLSLFLYSYWIKSLFILMMGLVKNHSRLLLEYDTVSMPLWHRNSFDLVVESNGTKKRRPG